MTRARTFLSCLKRIARRREDDHRCNISPMGMLFEYWMLLTQGMLSVESSVGKHLKKNSMATKGLDPQVKPNWHLFICSVWRTRFFFLCWCLCDDLNASTWRFSGTGHFHAPVDTSLHRFLLWNLFENLYQIFFFVLLIFLLLLLLVGKSVIIVIGFESLSSREGPSSTHGHDWFPPESPSWFSNASVAPPPVSTD